MIGEKWLAKYKRYHKWLADEQYPLSYWLRWNSIFMSRDVHVYKNWVRSRSSAQLSYRNNSFLSN